MNDFEKVLVEYGFRLHRNSSYPKSDNTNEIQWGRIIDVLQSSKLTSKKKANIIGKSILQHVAWDKNQLTLAYPRKLQEKIGEGMNLPYLPDKVRDTIYFLYKADNGSFVANKKPVNVAKLLSEHGENYVNEIERVYPEFALKQLFEKEKALQEANAVFNRRSNELTETVKEMNLTALNQDLTRVALKQLEQIQKNQREVADWLEKN